MNCSNHEENPVKTLASNEKQNPEPVPTTKALCQTPDQSVITNQPPTKKSEVEVAPSTFDHIDLCPKYWFRECQCCFQTSPTNLIELALRFCFISTCLPFLAMYQDQSENITIQKNS